MPPAIAYEEIAAEPFAGLPAAVWSFDAFRAAELINLLVDATAIDVLAALGIDRERTEAVIAGGEAAARHERVLTLARAARVDGVRVGHLEWLFEWLGDARRPHGAIDGFPECHGPATVPDFADLAVRIARELPDLAADVELVSLAAVRWRALLVAAGGATGSGGGAAPPWERGSLARALAALAAHAADRARSVGCDPAADAVSVLAPGKGYREVTDAVVSAARRRGVAVLAAPMRPAVDRPVAREFVERVLARPRLPAGRFLAPREWRRALAREGFADVEFVPEPSAAVAAYPNFALGAVVVRGPRGRGASDRTSASVPKA